MYKIVRFFFDTNRSPRTIATHLTLEEAQEHCRNPETSSSTCQTPAKLRYTRKVGKWFDGFRKM